MTSEADPKIVAEIMREGGLAPETRLYRSQLPEFLVEEAGVALVTANADSSEAVIDAYGGGHIAVAGSVGPGLAFTESPGGQWAEDSRVEIQVRLGDVLDQGGLVYPVESVITERVWYVTLPAGAVRVTQVS